MERYSKKQKIESAWTSHTIQLKDPGAPTMSEVIFYSIISDDSQDVTPTECSIFAVNPEGVHTCSRLGLIPRNPLLLLLSVAGKQYVLEVSTKQDVYGLYSDKQIRSAKAKMKDNRIPSGIKRKAAAVAQHCGRDASGGRREPSEPRLRKQAKSMLSVSGAPQTRVPPIAAEGGLTKATGGVSLSSTAESGVSLLSEAVCCG